MSWIKALNDPGLSPEDRKAQLLTWERSATNGEVKLHGICSSSVYHSIGARALPRLPSSNCVEVAWSHARCLALCLRAQGVGARRTRGRSTGCPTSLVRPRASTCRAD